MSEKRKKEGELKPFDQNNPSLEEEDEFSRKRKRREEGDLPRKKGRWESDREKIELDTVKVFESLLRQEIPTSKERRRGIKRPGSVAPENSLPEVSGEELRRSISSSYLSENRHSSSDPSSNTSAYDAEPSSGSLDRGQDGVFRPRKKRRVSSDSNSSDSREGGAVKKLSAQDIKARKAVIGIVGARREAASRLSTWLVKKGNEIGLGDDQEHPRVFTPIFPFGSAIEEQIKACIAFGCDFIVFTDKTREEDKSYKIAKKYNIGIISNQSADYEDEQMEDLAHRALIFSIGLVKLHDVNEKLFEAKNNISDRITLQRMAKDLRLRYGIKQNPRLNSLDLSSFDPYDKDLDEVTLSNLKGENSLREVMIGDLGIDYRGRGAIVVIGGAGPMASDKMSRLMAVENGLFVLHISESAAPGKHRFESGVGPSYIEYYRNLVRYAKKIGASKIVIPCNTAHARIGEIFEGIYDDPESVLIDYRDATIRKVAQENKEMILLGTDRTTGVVGDGEKGENEAKISQGGGIYRQYLRNLADKDSKYEDFSIITPNKDQQGEIMKAIYLVKKGNNEEAKQKIKKVVEEVREEIGDNDNKIPVGLCCTELPLPFLLSEIETLNFVDNSDLVAESARVLATKEVMKSQIADLDDVYSDTENEEEPCPSNFKLTVYKDRAEKEFIYRIVLSVRDGVELEDAPLKTVRLHIESLAQKLQDNNMITAQNHKITVCGDDYSSELKNPYRITIWEVSNDRVFENNLRKNFVEWLGVAEERMRDEVFAVKGEFPTQLRIMSETREDEDKETSPPAEMVEVFSFSNSPSPEKSIN